MKNRIFSFLICMVFCDFALSQTITDIDGNVYNTVTIGSQTWMAENLKTKSFANGDAIPTTTSAVNNDSTSIFQWAYNNDPSNIAVYGRLYSWFSAIDSRNVCPTGWKVPDNNDWLTLSNYLGGDSIAGNKMKVTGTSQWFSTSNFVTNSSLFSGMPGGIRGNPSGFSNLGSYGNFWSTTPVGTVFSFLRGHVYRLSATNGAFTENVAVGNCGMSVRCIRNEPTAISRQLLIEKLSVFPNPATELITIVLPEISCVALLIYNSTGENVFDQKVCGKTFSIDINRFSPGIYLIRCINNQIISEHKFIKLSK